MNRKLSCFALISMPLVGCTSAEVGGQDLVTPVHADPDTWEADAAPAADCGVSNTLELHGTLSRTDADLASPLAQGAVDIVSGSESVGAAQARADAWAWTRWVDSRCELQDLWLLAEFVGDSTWVWYQVFDAGKVVDGEGQRVGAPGNAFLAATGTVTFDELGEVSDWTATQRSQEYPWSVDKTAAAPLYIHPWGDPGLLATDGLTNLRLAARTE